MVLELRQNIRLQEVGAIKIGRLGDKLESKRKQGYYYGQPKKLDHFLVVTKEKDASGNFIVNQEIMKKLGEHPTSLDIMLLYDDIDLNFYTYYGFYQGKKCLCHGDGETAIRKKRDGSQEKIVCDINTCAFAKKDSEGTQKCKLNGVLQVLLKEADIVGGVYVYRTTGRNSCYNLIASMLLVQSITGGMLAGIPFKLTLQPKMVSPENSSDYWKVFVVNIIYPYGQQRLLETAIDIAKRRMTAGVELKKIHDRARQLISAPLEESDEEAQDIVNEFYPEAQDQFIEYVEDDTSVGLTTKDKANQEPEIVENFDDGDFSEEENQNGKNNGNNNVKNNGGQQEDLLIEGVL